MLKALSLVLSGRWEEKKSMKRSEKSAYICIFKMDLYMVYLDMQCSLMMDSSKLLFTYDLIFIYIIYFSSKAYN